MTKSKFLFFLFLLLQFNAFSQNNFDGNITWSEPLSKSQGETYDVIGVVNEELYVSNNINNKTFLQTYDAKNLLLKNSREIIMEYNKIEVKEGFIFIFGDKPMMISSYYDKKTKNKF